MDRITCSVEFLPIMPSTVRSQRPTQLCIVHADQFWLSRVSDRVHFQPYLEGSTLHLLHAKQGFYGQGTTLPCFSSELQPFPRQQPVHRKLGCGPPTDHALPSAHSCATQRLKAQDPCFSFPSGPSIQHSIFQLLIL